MKSVKVIILTLSFFCLFSCAAYLAEYFIDSCRAQSDIDALINNKEQLAEEAAYDSKKPTKKTMLPQYEEMYQKNPDLIGWIKIENTAIDYPVMQNQQDGEYYLHRNFNKEYEYSGLPFLDKRCDVNNPSTNMIIYGHNMKSETMFSSLTNYKDVNYYKEHPVIRFDTLYEEQEYEIFAVILSKVYKKTDNTFKFYQFVNADTKEEFAQYRNNIKKLALYDTGIQARYGDQLLTLVTCSYHTENGRLAVLAKKLD